MTDEIFSYIQEKARRRVYRPGEMVFCQGDEPQELFYLVSGLSLTYSVLEDGQERSMLITWPGRFFGAATMFEGVKRRSSAIALKPCEVLIIGRALYDDCAARFPDFNALLLREISADLGTMFEQLVDSSLLDTDSKVARFICRRLTRRQCSMENGLPTLHYTQEFIARVLGISRPSVSLALSALAARGLITTSYGSITVRDAEALCAYAYEEQRKR